MAKEHYNQLMEEGPFPNQIDPWAEDGHYFHQVHGQIIGNIINQISSPLRQLGYRAGREVSVLITEKSKPDIFVLGKDKQIAKGHRFAEAVQLAEIEAGVSLSSEALELDRIFIQSRETGKLVTVLELVSPSNKNSDAEIEKYKNRRQALLEQGVHSVEIDLTRSNKRLLDEPTVHEYPYHIVVHLSDDLPYFWGIRLNEAPKVFALPLRGEILRVDLNAAYRQAYIDLSIADQILDEKAYHLDSLPFPSLLSEEERKDLLAKVEAWKAKLKEAEK